MGDEGENMNRNKQAYDYLLELILSGKLLPGEPIIETKIAEELHTSRTPLREALKTLETEGLVSNYPLKGTFVAEITPYDIEEIFSLRIVLEICALRTSYNRISAEELADVEGMFTALNEHSTNKDYHMADRKLHSLIVDKAGNKRLKRFLNMLNVQIERFRRIAAYEPTRLKHSREEHLEIIHCLQNRDLQACEDKLRKHLQEVKESTLQTAREMSISGRFNEEI